MDKNLKDHKTLGQELELFFTDDVAPGAPFWLPNGMIIFKELEKYIRDLTEKAGYLEISTPIMVKSQLFKDSGHWTKFGEHNMYNLLLSDDENDKHPETYTLKPMNCPESTIIYRFKPRSYRELPLRLSEIGRLHRREKSGEVNGLLRVRQLTMDDAHIYVREDQIFEEVSNILDMMISFYKNFGFEYEFRFATRPEVRAGKDKDWDKAEKDLEEVLKKKGIKAGDKKGDGAFYGPKIDLHIKDSLGRQWQLATVQLDFHMPQAFDLKYVNEKGEFEKPVMIHRAIFGSFERFIGILTEHFQGAFPLWLAPVQVLLLPITDEINDYAEKLNTKLLSQGIRSTVDLRNERLQAKIRDGSLQKVPFLGIIGKVELEEKSISVRLRNGKDLGKIKISDLIEKLKQEIDKKI
ncbi:MAG: threonine--tRNA ligase [Patescibacteria group bacterium]|nr:threonine--tRNA ligase [Actinomycetota bacterium]MCL5970096.1 threonine--tRNA ligase [Patescibacteria group bacterium]